MLSSATVRNVMADLEELGFVTSPHTSAGRVPDRQGLPVLRRYAAATRQRRRGGRRGRRAAAGVWIDEHPQDAQGGRRRRLAGAVVDHAPRGRRHACREQAQQSLSQIEFLPLSDNRVLAVMVVNGRDVQNRIVQLDRYYSADELRRAANFLNQQFGGKDLCRRCARTSSRS